jgi:hypothetical protein
MLISLARVSRGNHLATLSSSDSFPSSARSSTAVAVNCLLTDLMA